MYSSSSSSSRSRTTTAGRKQLRLPSRRLIILCLAVFAILPPLFFHFRLRRFHHMLFAKCAWLNHPPLVCAHGGDSSKASPNTVCFSLYSLLLLSPSSFLDFVLSCLRWLRISPLFVLTSIASRLTSLVLPMDSSSLSTTGRDLQRLSGNTSSRVGHMTSKQIRELSTSHQSIQKLNDESIVTIQDALMLTTNSVRQIILDVKVGPPFYEKGLAKDIISIVEKTECRNCLIWAKSDNIMRDVIKLSSEITVGYIVIKDLSTGARTNLLRMKGAEVVGVYHPLIDKKLMRVLHRRKKKVYAWTVDDEESMEKLLFEDVDAIVTGNPTLLQRLMQDIKTQCLEEGYSLPR